MPNNINVSRRISIEELTDLQARALPRIKEHLDRSPLDPVDELPVDELPGTSQSGQPGVIVT